MLLGPIYDPHAQDAAHRFKGLAYGGGQLEPLISADALHWQKPVGAANIAGRWQGDTWAGEGAQQLTLDIVACGAGWCGP